MHRRSFLGCAALIVLVGAVPFLHGQTQSLVNADVVKLVQAGLGEAIILQTIKNAPSTAFELSPDALISLKIAGVSEGILNEMLAQPTTSHPATVTGTVVPTVLDVPDGTEIKLRLLTPASSATSRLEDSLRFEVVEDVKIGSVTIIQKSAEAKGRISEVKTNGSFGRSGKLSFSIDSVAALDGSSLPIRTIRQLKGDARVGTTVAAVALVGVFGGFVKGKNIDAPAGTEYTVFTDGARQVRPRTSD